MTNDDINLNTALAVVDYNYGHGVGVWIYPASTVIIIIIIIIYLYKKVYTTQPNTIKWIKKLDASSSNATEVSRFISLLGKSYYQTM